MAKFKLSKFFPEKDITKLKELAKEGIMLYPLFTSLNSADIKYATAVLKANKIKAGDIISKELHDEDPVYLYEDFVKYLLENKINLLTHDELLDHYNYNLTAEVGDYTIAEEKHKHYPMTGYFQLKDDNNEDANPIPVVILLYIRYIQQDGKL